MNELTFKELELIPEIQRAIDELGFEQTTDIQAQAIPLLRTGADVIGRSQTGTGKTIAFAIPAIEKIDTSEQNPTVQVLILCPTRELAQQGCDEVKKLTRFMRDIWPVDVYGGASMDRQIIHLRKANIVIGTPGRIMDHMRRGTIDLSHVNFVVLDEADEMLSMGFREDIETILKDTPETRQTALFSATMPEAIMQLTEQYQKDPVLIEINREQVTLDQIKQMCMDVPMGRKLDALVLLLHAYDPQRAMIFCNTKLMVDEVSTHLNKNGFTCEAIHGDLNQSQRTRVMEGFKSARLPILVCTDVAARGIDVNDVDYVINYDIPQNSESYVHRIGRTGRAGKEGSAVSICSGRRQFFQLRDIGKDVKSIINEIPIPTVADIRARVNEKNLARVEQALQDGIDERYTQLVSNLLEKGYDLSAVAAAAFQLGFAKDDSGLNDIVIERRAAPVGDRYRKLILTVGRKHKVAPNHVVSAIADRANIRGSVIGKIEIFDERTLVGIPASIAEDVVKRLEGLKICGIPVSAKILADKPSPATRPQQKRKFVPETPEKPPKGRIKLSREAKAKLLDAENPERFEMPEHKKEHRKDERHFSDSPRPPFNRDKTPRKQDRRPKKLPKHHG